VAIGFFFSPAEEITGGLGNSPGLPLSYPFFGSASPCTDAGLFRFLSASRESLSAYLMQHSKFRTPIATNLKRPANVGTKFVIAAAAEAFIEPSTWAIDRTMIRQVGELRFRWRGT